MIRNFLFLILIISLISCGYSPVLKLNENSNFNIKDAKLEGDRLVNNHLRIKFKRYNNQKGDNFNIFVKSNYEKIILSKDLKGRATDYKLQLNIIFDVRKLDPKENEEFNKSFSFNEEFVLKDNNFKFDEENDEKSIKRNLVDTIFDKFVIELINR